MMLVCPPQAHQAFASQASASVALQELFGRCLLSGTLQACPATSQALKDSWMRS